MLRTILCSFLCLGLTASIALPDDVLNKVYHDNAKKVLFF